MKLGPKTSPSHNLIPNLRDDKNLKTFIDILFHQDLRNDILDVASKNLELSEFACISPYITLEPQ